MGNPFRWTFGVVGRRRLSTLLRGPPRRVLGRVYRRVSILVVTPRLRSLASRVKDIEETAELAFSFRQYGISLTPLQVRDEVTEFLDYVKRTKPMILLEIGTAKGGTLLMLTRIALPRATIISLDLPRGSFGGGYPRWKIPLYRSFAKQEQKIHLLRADSHDFRTLEKVRTIIGSHKLDLLFIDGDHTYEGVKKDFEMYSPLVRRGGIVAFHDILPHDKLHDPMKEIGVDRFWRRLKDNHRCLEIVKNRRQGWAGIGILHV
ncbi:MAG: class I SAM-dependent methyltransferase [Promethearchaeati archaeon SRVP18_Atabeyarchaeia-1]